MADLITIPISKLRGHHITSLCDYIRWKEIKATWDIFERNRQYGYGDKFIENKRNLFERLYTNSSLEILIVANELDSLCIGGCQLLSKDCLKKTELDQEEAEYHKCKIGRIYLVSHFINDIRQMLRAKSP